MLQVGGRGKHQPGSQDAPPLPWRGKDKKPIQAGVHVKRFTRAEQQEPHSTCEKMEAEEGKTPHPGLHQQSVAELSPTRPIYQTVLPPAAGLSLGTSRASLVSTRPPLHCQPCLEQPHIPPLISCSGRAGDQPARAFRSGLLQQPPPHQLQNEKEQNTNRYNLLFKLF